MAGMHVEGLSHRGGGNAREEGEPSATTFKIHLKSNAVPSPLGSSVRIRAFHGRYRALLVSFTPCIIIVARPRLITTLAAPHGIPFSHPR